MVPPFFAYYGATTHNQTMVREAYNQIKLYRDVLRDPSANNLWKHIVLGTTHADPGHWSTGNAWVAAGILRVVGTIQNGPFANELGSEKDDLLNWVREIHDGMFKYLQPSNMWRNYADADKSFDDAAGTALLAASVYRINTLAGESKHLNKADEIRKTLFTGDKHVGTDGWLTPVVDPMDVGNEGKESPEGQAFVLELHAAYRDWNATGGHTTSGASAKTAFSGVFVASVASLVAAVLMC
jgi:rhamnogalacturonyl hydrolase YesR